MFYFILFNVFTYKTESSHVGTRLPECREAERSWLYSNAPPLSHLLSPQPLTQLFDGLAGLQGKFMTAVSRFLQVNPISLG